MSAAPNIETAPSTVAAARATNVMVVGVGGQGVLMISKALALIGQKQGLQVKQSEVHGMAKRGGVVFSHVRFGAEVWSPTICKGEADVLIALEWAEGLRWLEYLRPDTGVFIADTRRIVPPFACRSRRRGATMAYARETPAEVIDKVSEGYALDAAAIATGLGESRAANTVLLGVLSASMGVPVAEWLAVLEMLVPPKSRAINHKAFEAGRAWAEAAHDDASLRSTPALPGMSRTPTWRRFRSGSTSTRRGARAATSASSSARNVASRSMTIRSPISRHHKPAPAATCANGSAPTSRSKSTRRTMSP